VLNLNLVHSLFPCPALKLLPLLWGETLVRQKEKSVWLVFQRFLEIGVKFSPKRLEVLRNERKGDSGDVRPTLAEADQILAAVRAAQWRLRIDVKAFRRKHGPDESLG